MTTINPRFPLKVILKDHGSDFNLLPFLEHLEYEETGNDDISSATLKLNAHFGKFIKPVTQVGQSIPKINFFDRIYIEIQDDGGNKLSDVTEVLKIKPSEMSGVGDILELHCSHQGWHIFRIHNMKQYQRASGYDVIKDQGDVYNDDNVIGFAQPKLEGHNQVWNPATEIGVAASQATSIDFDFSNAEFFIGDAIVQTSDRLGSSVENGGELEFFDWKTISKYVDGGPAANLNKIQMQFRVSGAVAVKQKITKADAVAKILDTRSEQEPEKATHVFAWGDNNSGSLPVGFQIYYGEKEAFFAAPDWADNRNYKVGQKVQYKGVFYVVVLAHQSLLGGNDPISGIGVFWNVQTFTPTQDYSQWTKLRPQYWINSGAGYIHSGTFPQNNKAAMHDQNLVIRDVNHRRSWADVRITGVSAIPNSMYLDGGGDEMYFGFRVFLDTELGVLPLLQPFNQNGGKDRFGKNYADSVTMHNGSKFTGSDEYKNWDVFLEKKDDLEIIVMRDGDSYVYNPCSGLNFSGTCTGTRTPGWQLGAYQATQIAGLSIGAFLPGAIPDCLHPYNIVSANNPDFGTTQGIESGTPGANSAIRVKYDFADGARSQGAWLNLAFPIPRDGAAGAYTPTTAGEKYINPTLDLMNKHLSSIGKRGLNQGKDALGRGSLDYGKISAFRFYLKLINTALAGIVVPGGDFKVRIAFFDTSDNVVVKDVTVTHRDNWNEHEPKFPFEIYRGRHGIAFTPLLELEILDIFETRNVVRCSIATLDSYDGEGRYNPLNRFSALFGSLEMQLDAPHFVKPLTAMSQEQNIQANKPSRNLERAPLDRPQISNYVQLRNDAKSQLEIERFKRVEFEIKRSLRCNIKFGQEFTLKHPILVDDADIAPNDEVDLVCKKNIYVYTKGKGRGGMTTTTIGVKRFRT